MGDLKDILIFMGLDNKIFLKNLLGFFLLFFMVTGLTVVIFFLNFRFIRNNLIIGFYILLLLILNYYLKKSFYLKNQMILNVHFLKYLHKKFKEDFSGNSSNEYENDFSSKRMKKMFVQVSRVFKEAGSRFITRKVLLALSTLNLVNVKITFNQEIINKISWIIRKQYMIEFSIIGIIFLPFTLISILLSWGLWSGLRFLIFILAFIFVYYIYSSLFEPMVFLFIQKKICEMYLKG